MCGAADRRSGVRLCVTSHCILRKMKDDKQKLHEYKQGVRYVHLNINHCFFQSPCNHFQRHSSPPRSSDEEDDVIGHHDLVVVLHAGQSGADLLLREAMLPLLVDVVHQGLHLHRLSVSGLEHGEQRGLELLQPEEETREREDYISQPLEPLF